MARWLGWKALIHDGVDAAAPSGHVAPDDGQQLAIIRELLDERRTVSSVVVPRTRPRGSRVQRLFADGPAATEGQRRGVKSRWVGHA